MVATHVLILIAGIFYIPTFANPTSRILGGEEASKVGFPYAASVRLDNAHICGGSVIGKKTILTAAHCVNTDGNNVAPNRLTVRVGSTNQFSGGKVLYVAEVFVHPSYASEANNIAILRLDTAVELTNRVSVVDIASSSADEPGAGDAVVVAGWGEQSFNVSSHKLHSASFVVATEERCLDAFSSKDSSNFCLSHELRKGSCIGDAGNGAVYKNKLIGVNSFVVGACGSRYPDVYSNVSYYAPWIKALLV